MRIPLRIFLIGLPGAGKSTVGEHLASELTYSFFDLDEQIELKTGQTITEIFKEKSETYFRELEANQLRKMTKENMVVATGGGTPCFHKNMSWMNETGFTVFLNPPIEVIVERILKEDHRPLISGDVEGSLKKLLEKRVNLYEQAQMESRLSTPGKILVKLLNTFAKN